MHQPLDVGVPAGSLEGQQHMSLAPQVGPMGIAGIGRASLLHRKSEGTHTRLLPTR